MVQKSKGFLPVSSPASLSVPDSKEINLQKAISLSLDDVDFSTTFTASTTLCA